MEQIAHLVAHKLDQAVHIELRAKRLGDAVDGDQLGGTFADLAAPVR